MKAFGGIETFGGLWLHDFEGPAMVLLRLGQITALPCDRSQVIKAASGLKTPGSQPLADLQRLAAVLFSLDQIASLSL